MLTMHEPVTIAGRTVLLIEDIAVIQMPQHLRARLLDVPCTDTTVSLYTLRDAAERCAATYPGVPMYGLWQTLIASGLAGPADGLYRLDLAPPAGARYLNREETQVRTGWIAEGQQAAPFGAHRPDKVVHIVCDVAQLRLPDTPICSAHHQLEEQRQARLRSVMVLGPALACCLLAGAGADHLLDQHHVATTEHLRGDIRALEAERDRLTAWAHIHAFDQSGRLDALAQLARYPMPFTIAKSPLQDMIPTRLEGTEHLPPFFPVGLPIRHHNREHDGSVRILW